MIMEINVAGTVIIANFDNPSSSHGAVSFLLIQKQHPDEEADKTVSTHSWFSMGYLMRSR